MDDNKYEKEILGIIYNQINSFDNKAGIILSVVGIASAFFISFLEIFTSTIFINAVPNLKIAYIVFFILFVISAFEVVTCFILVVFPRASKSSIKTPSYYKSIVKMNIKDLAKEIGQIDSNQQILSQIKENAIICSKKHKCLLVGIISMIPYAALLLTLIILEICICI